MKKYHIVEQVELRANNLCLKINGKKYVFKLAEISKKLAAASKLEKENFSISPSGYGIHWSLLDEDISIDGLLGIKHFNEKSIAA